MSTTLEIDQRLMDAVQQAEHLAFNNPESHACVYRQKRSDDTSGSCFHVCLADEEAPKGSELVTTLTRRTTKQTGSSMSLGDAVRQVYENLPLGVQLHDQAIVEHYPKRAHSWDVPGIFCYQFMSTEMRNIGTWIPDTAVHGVLMQTGFDGRGRPWKNGEITNETTTGISSLIRAASIKEIDPGNECTLQFASGWRMAEEYLCGGTPPDADTPKPKLHNEEMLSGYTARMTRERELRAQANKSSVHAAPRRPRM